MAKFRMRKGVNINRVVVKVVATVLGLYVGGQLLTQIASTMTDTCSPFYTGLTLIGWTMNTTAGYTTCLADTSGSGILAVIGIVAIASIVTEFVQFKL